MLVALPRQAKMDGSWMLIDSHILYKSKNNNNNNNNNDNNNNNNNNNNNK